MAETIKEFLVGLSFEVDEASKTKFTNGIKDATKFAMKLGTVIASVNTAITAFTVSAARDIQVVAKLGDRIRSTTDDIERLIYIAGQTGSDEGSVLSSLDNLNTLIGQAATGVGGAQNLFLQYGLEARKANGEIKTTFEMMSELRGLLVRMAEPQRVAFLRNLGIDKTLMRALTDDTSKMSAEFAQLYKVIGVDSREATAASKALMDTIFKLTFIFDAVKKKIAVEVMPLITESFEDLRRKLISYIPFIVDKLSYLIKRFLELVDLLFDLGEKTVQVLKPMYDWIVDLNDATDGWLFTIGAIIIAWRKLNFEFLFSPIGILLALAAAFILLKDDYDTFMRGGDSLIDWSSDLGGELLILLDIFDWVKTKAKDLFIDALEAFKKFRDEVKDGGLKEALVEAFAPEWLKAISNLSKGNFKEAFGYVRTVIPGLALADKAGKGIMAAMNPMNPDSFTAPSAPSIINNTTINVTGSEPEATGRAVAREQNGVNANIVNSFKTIVQ